MYSTGNYIQYLVIIYSGKGSEAVHLTLTQYCKSTIVKFKKIDHCIIAKTYFCIHICNIDTPFPHIFKYKSLSSERFLQLYLEVLSQSY